MSSNQRRNTADSVAQMHRRRAENQEEVERLRNSLMQQLAQTSSGPAGVAATPEDARSATEVMARGRIFQREMQELQALQERYRREAEQRREAERHPIDIRSEGQWEVDDTGQRWIRQRILGRSPLRDTHTLQDAWDLWYESLRSTASETISGTHSMVWPIQYGQTSAPLAHIVVPIVESFPENAKPQDLVSYHEKIYVFDGRAWIPVVKEEHTTEEEKSRRIVVEADDAIEHSS